MRSQLHQHALAHRQLRHLYHRTTIACAALVLLTGCVTATKGVAVRGSASAARATTTGIAPTPSPEPALSFSDCRNNFELSKLISSDRASHLAVECGKLRVPLDYEHPNAATISIRVVRVRFDKQPKRIGALVVNPGGPGESGIVSAIYEAGDVSESVLQNFDIVGFDPRGVGASSPIVCLTNTQKDQLNDTDPNLLTAEGFQQAKTAAASLAQACAAKYGTALAEYNTIETTNDLDRLRAALGDQQLNYLGFSYGTTLGASYAHLFPTHVRVAVLDGAVDPLADPVTFLDDQLQGFEASFDQFAADCLKRSDCKKLVSPRQVVYDLVKRATTAPIKSSRASETRTAGPGIVLLGILSGLYSSDTWDDLGTAILQAQRGDSAGLFDLADNYNERSADGNYTNVAEANTAISCNDSPPAPDDAAISVAAAKWANSYPIFGMWAASALFECQAWQPVRHILPQPSATGSKPILVIGTVHDPATPYTGAQHLTTVLGAAVLLTWQGQGHTAYGRGSKCVDDAVNTYLISAAPPAPGTDCPQ